MLGSALNSSAFTCALSFPSIGVFSLEISCNQVNFGPSFADFEALAHPSLIRCVPSSASVLGGQRVTVVGQNLLNPGNSTIFCQFSAASTEPAVFASDSSVICLVPLASSSVSHMSFVSLLGFPYSWKNVIPFEYIHSNDTRILSIKPSLVSVGETTFTLSGHGFPSDAVCVFAGKNVPLSHDINGLAFCNINAELTGLSQFHIISHSRLVASTHVSVVALPKLLACQPSQVHLGWSGIITVSGTNFVFSNDLVCSFGKNFGYATFKSSQSMLCSLEFVSRDISIRVSNDGLHFSDEIFVNVASDIEIFHIQPTVVSSRHDTSVTLFGNMIPVNPFCVFEGTIFPSSESNSSVCVCIITPAGLFGNFSLGLFDGDSSYSQRFALVTLDASISAISPFKVPKYHLSTLRVEGFDVLFDLEWNCSISNGSQTSSFTFYPKSSSCSVMLPVAGDFVFLPFFWFTPNEVVEIILV